MRDTLEIGGNACLYVLTGVQTEQTFRIISLVLSIIISLCIIAGKIVEWYNKAKQDGKISKEEIKEGLDSISDDIKLTADEVAQVVEAIEEAKNRRD